MKDVRYLGTDSLTLNKSPILNGENTTFSISVFTIIFTMCDNFFV